MRVDVRRAPHKGGTETRKPANGRTGRAFERVGFKDPIISSQAIEQSSIAFDHERRTHASNDGPLGSGWMSVCPSA